MKEKGQLFQAPWLTVPSKVRLHRVMKRKLKHGKPERQAGLSLGSWIVKNWFQNILDSLPRQHFFSWLITAGCQQCFEITSRGVSFRARLGNLAGVWSWGRGWGRLLKRPRNLLVKQTEEGEGSWRDMDSGQMDCSSSFRMTLQFPRQDWISKVKFPSQFWSPVLWKGL